jgi:hypothetical protein
MQEEGYDQKDDFRVEPVECMCQTEAEDDDEDCNYPQ